MQGSTNTTWLIAGPPGCGKTTWIRNTLKAHQGSCGYLRLNVPSQPGLEQGRDLGVDKAWLLDQIPGLHDLSDPAHNDGHAETNALNLIEVQQFQAPAAPSPDALSPTIRQQLEQHKLQPDRVMYFGLDPALPSQDTLAFSRLEAWSLSLHDSVWDPNSLNSFWFELVNGAYGDVYRAKAIMNLPDGRGFFCNWIVSQQGSQFLPLETVEPPHGRPTRPSELVVQGKALNGVGIQTTIDDCLISDDVLEMHQAPMRDQQPQATLTR